MEKKEIETLRMPHIVAETRLQVRSGYDLASRQVEYALQFRVSPGTGEMKLGPDDPLERGFKASLVDGKPFEEWQFVVLHRRAAQPPVVVGTVVRTLGNRLLFFPAINLRLGKWISRDAPSLGGALLDHLTLDSAQINGRRRGHIKLLGREKRGRHAWNFRTRPRDGWHEWFSMLAPSIDDFPRLPAHTTLVFASGRADLQERFPDFVGRVSFPGMTVASAPDVTSSFLQIDVWAGEPEATAAVDALRPLPFVYSSQIVQQRPSAQEATVQICDLPFASGERIAVAATWFAGQIQGPLLLRASAVAPR